MLKIIFSFVFSENVEDDDEVYHHSNNRMMQND